MTIIISVLQSIGQYPKTKALCPYFRRVILLFDGKKTFRSILKRREKSDLRHLTFRILHRSFLNTASIATALVGAKIFDRPIDQISDRRRDQCYDYNRLHQFNRINVIHAPAYARTPMYTNWNKGQRQDCVSRCTTANVAKHCMAKA